MSLSISDVAGPLVVIFRATLKSEAVARDEDYSRTAARLRELAFERFGCLEFEAVNEGLREVAISTWPDEAAIRAWRECPEHVEAQRRGRERWYADYSVEVARPGRRYAWPA